MGNFVGPRENNISWAEYFMGIALLSAERSKDPSSQVGACIVSEDNKILSMGYNGTPRGIDDNDFNWNREGDHFDTKYPRVVHAEPNAILNYSGDTNLLKGATLYVTLFPCNECAKFIAQTGIKRIIYLSDKYADTDSVRVSKEILTLCNIRYEQFLPIRKTIELSYMAPEYASESIRGAQELILVRPKF